MLLTFVLCLKVYYMFLNYMYSQAITVPKQLTNNVDVNKIPFEKMNYFEIVYPKQNFDNYKNKKKRNTGRKKSKSNLEFDSFYSINFKNKSYFLDLSLNKKLLPSSFSVTTYSSKGQPETYNITERDTNHCFYQGNVRGINQSKVVISTCHGLKGSIAIDDDFFIIEPLQSESTLSLEKTPHVMYYPSGKNFNITSSHCGVVDFGYQVLHSEELEESSNSQDKESRNVVYESSLLNVAKNDKRFVELMLVADYNMYQRLGSINAVLHYLEEIANFVDGFYQEIGFRVILSGVEVWNSGNPFSYVQNNTYKTLDNFIEYRQREASKRPLSAWNYADVHHLLSGEGFSGNTIGIARIDVMCQRDAVGVNLDLKDAFNTASTVAHEMGHNFGMTHDSPRCFCPPKKECLMAANARFTSTLGWSSCSFTLINSFMKRGKDHCLTNVPNPSKMVGGPLCGNEIVEFGEECDCGYPQFCESKCCDPTKCKFFESAVCDLGSCCKDCQYVKANTVCRDAGKSACELTEYCNGISPYCPPNTYVQDGTPCFGEGASCLNGVCLTTDKQCKAVYGPGAKNAVKGCYYLNREGTAKGNCGYNADYQPQACSSEDFLCGKLHCTGGMSYSTSINLISTSVVLVYNQSVVTCNSLLAGKSNNDFDYSGLVATNTRCGEDKLCDRGKCNKPVPTCSQKCNGNGVCNNYDSCHCLSGFAPPLCISQGKGGSFDNGQYGDVFYGPVLDLHPQEDRQLTATWSRVQLLLTLSSVMFFLSFVIFFAFGFTFCKKRKTGFHPVKSEGSSITPSTLSSIVETEDESNQSYYVS